MTTKNNQMPNHEERIAMAQNFASIILKTTALSSGYIDIETTQFLSGYSREGAKQGLSRLSRQGYMNEFKVPNMTGQMINIYGLTREGWDFAEVERANWTKQRYRANTRNHEMTILKLAHQIGADEFIRAKNIGGKHLKSGGYSGGRYPDLLSRCDEAVEVELTIKSSKRYYGILHNYHLNKTKSVWYTPETIAHRLSRIFAEICEIKCFEKPQIFSFGDSYDATQVKYLSRTDEVKTFQSIEQLRDIEDLKTLLSLYEVDFQLDGFQYKPNPSFKSKKGLVLDLGNGFSIIAELKNESSKEITKLRWQSKHPATLFQTEA